MEDLTTGPPRYEKPKPPWYLVLDTNIWIELAKNFQRPNEHRSLLTFVLKEVRSWLPETFASHRPLITIPEVVMEEIANKHRQYNMPGSKQNPEAIDKYRSVYADLMSLRDQLPPLYGRLYAEINLVTGRSWQNMERLVLLGRSNDQLSADQEVIQCARDLQDTVDGDGVVTVVSNDYTVQIAAYAANLSTGWLTKNIGTLKAIIWPWAWQNVHLRFDVRVLTVKDLKVVCFRLKHASKMVRKSNDHTVQIAAYAANLSSGWLTGNNGTLESILWPRPRQQVDPFDVKVILTVKDLKAESFRFQNPSNYTPPTCFIISLSLIYNLDKLKTTDSARRKVRAKKALKALSEYLRTEEGGRLVEIQPEEIPEGQDPRRLRHQAS